MSRATPSLTLFVVVVLAATATAVSGGVAVSRVSEVVGNFTIKNIFSPEEIKKCVRIRGNHLIRTPTAILLSGRCCGKNMCSSHESGAALGEGEDELGDNNKDNLIYTKKSTDNGKTWHSFKIVSPGGKKGYSYGAGVYDRIRKRILFRFGYAPGGSTKPASHMQYYQMFSSDDGHTWSTPEDITKKVDGPRCTHSPTEGKGNMMYDSAGSKVQMSSGRILYPAHMSGPLAVVWFTDDGGNTWNCSNMFTGNEISVTQGNGRGADAVYMNGRGQTFAWKPHRADYWSLDDGSTIENATESGVSDTTGGPCEGSLLSIDNTIFFAEPTGIPNVCARCRLQVHCSLDNAQTWPHTVLVNGDGHAGYTGMVQVPGGILITFENGDDLGGGIQYTTIDTAWCG